MKQGKTRLDAALVERGLEISPITGPKGNREFLLYVKKNGEALSQTSLCALAAAAARR